MTLRILFLFVTLLAPSMAFAQIEGKGQSYLVGTFGGWTGAGGWQVGAAIGGERLIYKGLAAGGEFGGFAAMPRYGGVVASANVSYHFRNPGTPRRLVPFATAGVSALGACGGSACIPAGGFNLGGGVNYWVKPHRGIRVEFRDHLLYDDGPTHKLEMRIGYAF